MLVAMSSRRGEPVAGAEIAIGLVCSAGAAPGAAVMAKGGVVPPSRMIVTQPCAAPRSAQGPCAPRVSAADHGRGGDPAGERTGRGRVDGQREGGMPESASGVDGRERRRTAGQARRRGQVVARQPGVGAVARHLAQAVARMAGQFGVDRMLGHDLGDGGGGACAQQRGPCELARLAGRQPHHRIGALSHSSAPPRSDSRPAGGRGWHRAAPGCRAPWER